MAKLDQKDYTHYVLVFKNGDPLIESGWSYPEDAREHVKENLPKKLITKTVSRKRMPIDPKDDANWFKGSAWGDEGVKLYHDKPGMEGVGSKRDKLNSLDAFTEGYIAAALWSSTDNADDSGGEPLDANYDTMDISNVALDKMISDCKRFQKENAKMLSRAGDASQNGHDFWLTRNGHGAGFWDRGYDDEVGNALTDAAHRFGTVDLYVSNGKIYS